MMDKMGKIIHYIGTESHAAMAGSLFCARIGSAPPVHAVMCL